MASGFLSSCGCCSTMTRPSVGSGCGGRAGHRHTRAGRLRAAEAGWACDVLRTAAQNESSSLHLHRAQIWRPCGGSASGAMLACAAAAARTWPRAAARTTPAAAAVAAVAVPMAAVCGPAGIQAKAVAVKAPGTVRGGAAAAAALAHQNSMRRSRPSADDLATDATPKCVSVAAERVSWEPGSQHLNHAAAHALLLAPCRQMDHYAAPPSSRAKSSVSARWVGGASEEQLHLSGRGPAAGPQPLLPRTPRVHGRYQSRDSVEPAPPSKQPGVRSTQKVGGRAAARHVRPNSSRLPRLRAA